MLESKELHTTIKKPDNRMKVVESQPFKYLSSWDFVVIFIAILFRVLVTMNQKSEELNIEGKVFLMSKYWDSKHVLRWLLHIVSSIIIIMTLPEFFVEVVQKRYFTELESWTLFASGIIGYLGYDMLKVFERVGKGLFKKIGVEID